MTDTKEQQSEGMEDAQNSEDVSMQQVHSLAAYAEAEEDVDLEEFEEVGTGLDTGAALPGQVGEPSPQVAYGSSIPESPQRTNSQPSQPGQGTRSTMVVNNGRSSNSNNRPDPLASQSGPSGLSMSSEEGPRRGSAEKTAIDQLRTIWLNEKACPELLSYEEEVVQTVKDHVKSQQDIILDTRRTGAENFMCNLYQMEIDRVNYMLASYLRIRLKKIERHVLWCLMPNYDVTDRLSQAEFEFAKGYLDLLEHLFKKNLLDHLPANFQKFNVENEDEQMVDVPDLDTFVFLRVTQEEGHFMICDDPLTEVELNKGDLLVAAYSPFRSLLLENRVELI